MAPALRAVSAPRNATRPSQPILIKPQENPDATRRRTVDLSRDEVRYGKTSRSRRYPDV